MFLSAHSLFEFICSQDAMLFITYIVLQSPGFATQNRKHSIYATGVKPNGNSVSAILFCQVSQSHMATLPTRLKTPCSQAACLVHFHNELNWRFFPRFRMKRNREVHEKGKEPSRPSQVMENYVSGFQVLKPTWRGMLTPKSQDSNFFLNNNPILGWFPFILLKPLRSSSQVWNNSFSSWWKEEL